MATHTHHDEPLWRRLGPAAAALVAAATFGLAGASVASAQQPGSAAPPGDLSLGMAGDPGTVKEDDDYRVEITVRNSGPGIVSDAILEIDVEDEFDIEEVSEVGDKTLIREDDDTLVYALGPLAPGQTLEFSIHGEFEGVDKDDSGDTLEVIADVSSATAGSDRDIEEVDVRDDT
jgi:hypothetical protein